LDDIGLRYFVASADRRRVFHFHRRATAANNSFAYFCSHRQVFCALNVHSQLNNVLYLCRGYRRCKQWSHRHRCPRQKDRSLDLVYKEGTSPNFNLQSPTCSDGIASGMNLNSNHHPCLLYTTRIQRSQPSPLLVPRPPFQCVNRSLEVGVCTVSLVALPEECLRVFNHCLFCDECSLAILPRLVSPRCLGTS
jgi:hypothetical protein